MPKRKRPSFTPKRKRKPPPEEEFFEVREILDERINEKGVVEYLLDWEDNKKTGKKYTPDWLSVECLVGGTENLSLVAWEQKKRLRELATSNPQFPVVESDTQPASSSALDTGNNNHWRESSTASPEPNPAKRQRRESDEHSHGSFKLVDDKPKNKSELVIAVPAVPLFDRSDYVEVDAGQASTQSQQLISPVLDDEPALDRAPISQTTIPDSQELPDSFPSVAATIGDAVTDKSQDPEPNALDFGLRSPQSSLAAADNLRPNSPQGHSEVTGLSFGERQVVTASHSPRSCNLPLEVSGTPGQEENFSSSQGFLTQPEFALETQLAETSQAIAASGTAGVVATGPEDKRSGEESHETTAITSPNVESGTPQSAQVIPASIEVEQTQQADLNSSATAPGRQVTPRTPTVSDTPTRREATTSGISPARSERHSPPSTTEIGVPVPVSKTATNQIPAVVTSDEIVPPTAEGKQVARDPVTRTDNTSSQRLSLSPFPQSSDMEEPLDFDPEDVFAGLKALHAELGLGRPLVPGGAKTEPAPVQPVQPLQPPEGLDQSGISPSVLHSEETATLKAATNLEEQNTAASSSEHGAIRPSVAEASLFGNHLGLAPLDVDRGSHSLPVTIAPSQLDMSAAGSNLHDTLPPGGQPLFRSEDTEETALPRIGAPQLSVEQSHGSSSRVVEKTGGSLHEFLVTLPMLASTRSLYIDTLRSNSAAMARYSSFFATDSAGNPDEQLISEVDDVYRRLHEHCDLPQFATSIPRLDPKAMMKHATGTNSKYSFVYEFIEELKHENVRVLIVSQPGLAADYLETIYKFSRVTTVDLEAYMADMATSPLDLDGFTVIFATSEMEGLARSLIEVDAVILFDAAARQVWQDQADGAHVLSLVVANSIEHIDMQLPDSLDDLERRNAMNFALVTSKNLINDPSRMTDPDKLGALFADFVKDPAQGMDWEPYAIPDEMFDFYMSSQVGESQRHQDAPAHASSNGRKRLLGSEDGLSTPTKRARTANSARPPLSHTSYFMSDLLKNTLSGYTPRPQGSSQTVEVTIDQLEWMAARIARLEDSLEDKSKVEERLREVVKQLEFQVKSYNETILTLRDKLTKATSDQITAETQMKDAHDHAGQLENLVRKYEQEKRGLEMQIAALSKPKSSTDASEDETRAELATKLQETQAKLDAVEKKYKAANNNLEFFRTSYQDTSTSVSELKAENDNLKLRMKHLEHRASNATIRIHEINSKNMEADLRHRHDDDQATIAQQQQRIDRLEKERGALKNGRRETRQTSVPRSPRLAVISPRTRGVGAGSRGTSPTPFDGSSTPSSAAAAAAAGQASGMNFFNQAPVANPRWNHLRE